MTLADDPAGESRPRSLLRHRDFLWLLAGQTTSQLGTQVSGVAVPMLAVGALGATAFQVGLLGAASTVAFLLVGLQAGAWVDRMPCRPVLVAADVVRAAAFLTVPVAAWQGALTMTHLLLVVLVGGFARVFFDVGYQSYVPALVGRDRVLSGNSAMELLRSGGQVAGPGLGGLLVSLVGAANVLLVQAGTFAVSAATLLAIRTRETRARARPTTTLRADIREGLRFVLHHRVLRSVAAASALSNLSFAIGSAVTMIFLLRTLGLPPWGVGVAVAVGSGAAVAGAALTPWVSGRVGSARVIWLSLAVTVPLTLVVPLARPGWSVVLVVVGIAAGELGQIVYAVTNVSLRQRLAPDHILGRVNATTKVIIMALYPLGAIAGGLLGDAVGPRWTLVAAGLVGLGAPVVLLAALRGCRDVEDLALGGQAGSTSTTA